MTREDGGIADERDDDLLDSIAIVDLDGNTRPVIVVAELGTLEHAGPTLRTEFDHLLLTVHERIDHT
ncbi:hypothetical protein [Nocardia sp. NBC_01329]|uniref:hypothetical protein n=1 Tax=Nocardia sp. NBC_01329 TaxID=2903594 RepID=UPI002E14F672|nr:hypothetical protein OG405_16610 [Nocardia sp. NBC_01329]